MNKTRLFLIIQSVLCILLAGMFAAAAIGIYREGLVLKAADPLNWIYTREKAAAALRPTLPLLVLSLSVTAVGLFLGIRDENGEKPVKNTECMRDLTVGRVAEESAEMKAERSRQKRLLCGGWIVFALCMIPVLLYITNGDHFPNGDLEPVFLALVGKEQIKAERASGVQPETKKEENKSLAGKNRLLRAVVLALAVVLIIAGVFNGSARDVFGKAVKICTECVGLG